mgnify:CR=1 FL=1
MNLLRQRCAVFGIAFFILFALFSPRVQANAYEAELPAGLASATDMCARNPATHAPASTVL